MFNAVSIENVGVGTFSYGLVFLSLVAAVFACFTALDLAIRINENLGVFWKKR